MPGECPRIDVRQTHQAEALHIGLQTFPRAPIRVEAADFANDKTRAEGLAAFGIFFIHPIIADMRRGHRNDLALVGRICENFLIAGHGRVKNNFTGRLSFSAKGGATKNAAGF